jgi:hypothetical protein
MTEDAWLRGTDPTPLLEFLWGTDRLPERKGRLFAAGCCRRVWHLLNDRRSEQAVEVVERWADGEARHEELATAHASAWQAWGTPARSAASEASAVPWALGVTVAAAHYTAWAGRDGSRADERRAQAELLRCLVGNPFRPRPAVLPVWMRWNGGVVRCLAESIYDGRAFDQVGVLADAVEEAGCDSPEILGHLRGLGPHARGCWVLDLIRDTG